MAYRLPTDRVQVTSGDLTIEVSSVVAWPIAHTTTALVGAFYRAKPGDAEMAALRDLYAYFVLEAQPSWDIVDHRGTVPATAAGLLRLPVETALGLIGEWIGTLIPEPTVADEVLPDGPVRDEVNAALKAARRKGRRDGE